VGPRITIELVANMSSTNAYVVAAQYFTASRLQLDLLFLHRPVATQPENNSRLQALLKKYGKAGLIVWVVVSILVLFACYAAIEMGVDTVCLNVADLYLDAFTKISPFDMQELAD
jgi:hypothetical protein